MGFCHHGNYTCASLPVHLLRRHPDGKLAKWALITVHVLDIFIAMVYDMFIAKPGKPGSVTFGHPGVS